VVLCVCGFCVMCEVRRSSFVYTVGHGLWCLLCDWVCILCCVAFCILRYGVFLALMSVVCWLNVHGSVYVSERVFPVCCVLSVL